MSKQSVDANVVFNKANVALARSQRLVQSWIGPVKGEGAVANLWDVDEDEDDFKAEPETLGLGAKAPDDATAFGLKRKQPSMDEKLLEQLLGKKGAKYHQAKKAEERAKKPCSKPSSELQHSNIEESNLEHESDDEGGRASHIAKRGRRLRGHLVPSDQSDTESKGFDSTSKQTMKASKRSYLDQILAQKASKRRKSSK